MAPKVLLVDDDVELAGLLSDYLRSEGFDVEVAHDGTAGAAAALAGGCDLVVLDVMMPRKGGIEALTEIRRSTTLPVLMLTARGDDADRITGLELGADDYVQKPCTPRELAARIRAILRRASAASAAGAGVHESIVVGSLTIWPGQRRAEQDGKPLDLTSTEFNLLEMLARHAGSVVSKLELSRAALGRPLNSFDRSIDVHMSRIRSKLGQMADGRSRIQTVIRQGYQLIVE
jgi:DNA-binding response OmpR family regulator